ncbi:helix-turn-helix domain-containing protein [Aureibaculum sp. 2210JD6-5]|uniref:helix-turn-helix domain-containing protein n=1 Tax=Aureibaculum sp. 2210JD6-5 TaxID=3103957 RepID=UPI002AAEE5FA|nr:helix-turn-helix domain-containing protein [Aureibaculum sp. 2210JD6-5]MDY7396751.1 helix-turn-helix domain-containing protein [Aureibaculum sp. 2210JD6-5]
MAKQIDIVIHESESELKALLNQQTKLLEYQRAKALLLIKQGKVSYTYQLAKKLKRERKTIYNWLKLYAQEGIASYLKIKSRGSRKEQIPKEVKEALSVKLSDSSTSITSYVELLEWIENHFGLVLNYKTLYSHCRAHYNSVLKVARKSHHKKDDKAVEAFKKLPDRLLEVRTILNKDKYDSMNLYFQDESRFRLMTKQN